MHVFHGESDPFIALEKSQELAKNLETDMTLVPEGKHLNATAGFMGGTAFQGWTCSAFTAGVMAVGFDVGISSDPVTSRVEVTVVTSDGKEQTFSVAGKGTGIGGSRRVTPVFAGFTSSRASSRPSAVWYREISGARASARRYAASAAEQRVGSCTPHAA